MTIVRHRKIVMSRLENLPIFEIFFVVQKFVISDGEINMHCWGRAWEGYGNILEPGEVKEIVDDET